MPTDIEPADTVTAKPYFPPVGYLIIEPISPVSLYVVDGGTVAGYLEGITYWPIPRGVIVRELACLTS